MSPAALAAAFAAPPIPPANITAAIVKVRSHLDHIHNTISEMNVTETDFFSFFKDYFPDSSVFEQLYSVVEPVVESCQNDEDTYCNGTMKTVANAYKNVHGYLSLVVCVFGSITNTLNILTLARKEMSMFSFNRLLAALAIADLIVSLEYIPFAVYMYLIFPGTRNFPYSWAVFFLFHVHFSQVFHTISICLTLTLAMWRLIAIRYPQWNSTWCSDHKCMIYIGFSYLIPLIMCIPTYLVFYVRTTTIKENSSDVVLYHLDLSDMAKGNNRALCTATFWIYGVIIKIIPCVVLTVITFWLVQALVEMKKRKMALKFQPPAPTYPEDIFTNMKRIHKFDKKTDRVTKMLVAVLILFLITEIPQGIMGLLSGIYGTCFFRHCYNLFGEIMDLLALINGSLNFIFYCVMNRQFRHACHKIFNPDAYLMRNPRVPVTDYRNSFV